MRGPPDAYPFPTLSAPARFGVAILVIGSVAMLDRFGGAILDNSSLFLLLGTAVMVVALVAGTGPAVAATALAAVVGVRQATGVSDSATGVHLGLLLAQGLLLTSVVAELRRARRDAEDRAQDAQVARELGESANRLKDEFLGTISHELRTPLNAVLGWVHLLSTGKLDAPTAARGLQSIDRNVRLQAQLTSDLLDVSKALTGKLQLDSRSVRLDDAARQAIAATTPAAQAKDVRIDATLPPDGVSVHGDPSRLRQIAWQLLANAVKFSPRSGHVQVAVDAFGQDARLIVRDTGAGIDPTFLPRIFERFTQADASVTRSAGGLGVGLALVRELVELHGGEIEARNRGDRNGAIFIVRFPLRATVKAPAAPVASAAKPTASNGPVLDGLRVLVLDQEAEGRDLLRTLLHHRGAIVQAVSSIEEALQSLEAWRPDLLVSDSLSPDHDSYALIGKVQALDAERGGRIPAVALTSVARTDRRLRDLLAGVQRDLPKPVEPAVLTHELARLAGRERRRVQR
jgi:signal transduction histidine kinase/CheY-like chemotaxis protein